MEYFLNNQNTALDRASILNHIWGDGYFGDDKLSMSIFAAFA